MPYRKSLTSLGGGGNILRAQQGHLKGQPVVREIEQREVIENIVTPCVVAIHQNPIGRFQLEWCKDKRWFFVGSY